MKKLKVINLQCFGFRTEDKTLIVSGTRGDDFQFYRINLHFTHLGMFKVLGKLCISHLRKTYTDIKKQVLDIKES